VDVAAARKRLWPGRDRTAGGEIYQIGWGTHRAVEVCNNDEGRGSVWGSNFDPTLLVV